MTTANHLTAQRSVGEKQNKLSGNDMFTDEIVQQFSNSHLFISVLSPRYIESSWCIKEIKEFCDLAEGDKGLTVGNNKSRVFKVLKLPVDHEDAQSPQRGHSHREVAWLPLDSR